MSRCFRDSEPSRRYLNFYKCINCRNEWEDSWDAMCDDECPQCGTIMTPYQSDNLLL